MPDSTLEDARFDHVGHAGELIFSAVGLKFAVQVDETLERAILEAKEIQSENVDEKPRKASPALPISQIQALIRAGVDPAQVSKRYELSNALVRRFSKAVETEKQYAIEQFLNVPAPKESRVHNILELVERTLSTAGINFHSVKWRATRRGLEPWRITAEFSSAGRKVHAEWTWNMHDNAVISKNSAARTLFGEHSPAKDGSSRGDGVQYQDAAARDADGKANTDTSRNSARFDNRERTVSAWEVFGRSQHLQSEHDKNSDGRDRNSPTGDDRSPSLPNPSRPILPRQDNQASEHTQMEDNSFGNPGSLNQRDTQDSVGAQSEDRSSETSSQRKRHRLERLLDRRQKDGRPSDNLDQGTFEEDEPDEGEQLDNKTTETTSRRKSKTTVAGNKPWGEDSSKSTPSKRKSGRSAVPSWDEILFGD